MPHRGDNACYAKLVCHIGENMRVLGLHICGPNSGEITQVRVRVRVRDRES